MMTNETKQPISLEILDIIEWLSAEENTDYEKGMLTGLRIAECVAEIVERHSEVDNNATD